MKVSVDGQRCQGHTLCSMIAPDSFELDDVDGHASPVSEVVPADQEDAGRRSRALMSRAGHRHRMTLRPMTEPYDNLGDTAVSIDSDEPLARRADDDVATDDDRKKNRYHFDRHTPEYREQFQNITEEMHAKCPVAWTDVYDGHWVAAGSKRRLRTRALPGDLQRSRPPR